MKIPKELWRILDHLFHYALKQVSIMLPKPRVPISTTFCEFPLVFIELERFKLANYQLYKLWIEINWLSKIFFGVFDFTELEEI